MCVRFGITTNALVIGSLGKPTNEPPAPVSVGSVADVSPHPLLQPTNRHKHACTHIYQPFNSPRARVDTPAPR